MEELQKIINEKAGTGTINLDKNGEWKNAEIINAGKIIGFTVNRENVKIWTEKAKIHYRKTGTHIVPYSGR